MNFDRTANDSIRKLAELSLHAPHVLHGRPSVRFLSTDGRYQQICRTPNTIFRHGTHAVHPHTSIRPTCIESAAICTRSVHPAHQLYRLARRLSHAAHQTLSTRTPSVPVRISTSSINASFAPSRTSPAPSRTSIASPHESWRHAARRSTQARLDPHIPTPRLTQPEGELAMANGRLVHRKTESRKPQLTGTPCEPADGDDIERLRRNNVITSRRRDRRQPCALGAGMPGGWPA